MRTFSVAEANAYVPFLQRSFERVRRLSSRAAVVGEQLLALGDRSLPGTPIPDHLPPEHRRLRRERDRLVQQIRSSLGLMAEFGIVVRSPHGLVDFPAQRNGRTVSLCWRYGEPSVSHWHELQDGFEGRMPIRDPSRFGTPLLN